MIRFKSRILASYISLIILITATNFYSCQNQKKDSPKEKLNKEAAEGKILALKYCASCHQYPDPSLIDKITWERGILPAMAKKLGLEQYMGQIYAVKSSAISTSEWTKIVSYYKTLAPARLAFPPTDKNIQTDFAIFKVKRPVNLKEQRMALTTYVGFNPNDRRIYSADATNNLYRWNTNLQPQLCQTLPSPGTGIIFNRTSTGINEGIVTCIGVLPPNDLRNGKLLYYNLDKKQTPNHAAVYADSLPRAVQSVAVDFDKDGLVDYAVCGFGNNQGGLYWLKQSTDHHFKTLPIRLIPGASQIITGDYNNDGWPDLMCLFAQADEGIWLFLNDRKGGFISRNILHFPPIYGSSSFQLADFNHDNQPDILYTAGDNSDYSKVLKPYHGVYIFLNDGNFHFTKKYFYHIDGCTKAVAADFKQNGNLDIAVISFFADFKNDPSEGFQYLEQTGHLQFTAHKIPVQKFGRWLTMDVSDYNNDNFPDVILGNFSMGGNLINQKDFKPNWDTREPLIILENTTKVNR